METGCEMFKTPQKPINSPSLFDANLIVKVKKSVNQFFGIVATLF